MREHDAVDQVTVIRAAYEFLEIPFDQTEQIPWTLDAKHTRLSLIRRWIHEASMTPRKTLR